MANLLIKQVKKVIKLADLVIKMSNEDNPFHEECAQLTSNIVSLVSLLREVAKVAASYYDDFYDRPAVRIMEETEAVLEQARSLVLKCRAKSLIKRVLTILPSDSFSKMAAQIQDSIGDLDWLLRIWDPALYRLGMGLPPISQNNPIVSMIWESIAILYRGSLEERSDAATTLVSLARDSKVYAKLILEEGGVGPVFKMINVGNSEDQQNAARLIGLLGHDSECVDHLIQADVCSIFAKILKKGQMKVQVVVAWALSELVKNYPKSRDIFAQYNVIRLLVSHLEFGTIDGHNIEGGAKKAATSMHAIVMLSNNSKANTMRIISGFEDEDESQSKISQLKWESEDPDTKAEMKAMAARALCEFAKGNLSICRSIAETRALLCFSVLLEKGQEEVKYNCATVLVEITSMAELDIDFKRAALKPSSAVYKALVDQLQMIIVKRDSAALVIPCIQSIGNLASTLRGMGIRMISPLVQFLRGINSATSEALVALTKLSCTDNYLHLNHSKAIISADGIKHLLRLCEGVFKTPALILLCYICLHVPNDEEVTEYSEVLVVLRKKQADFFLFAVADELELLHHRLKLLHDATDELELLHHKVKLLHDAIDELELYHRV